MKSSAHYFVTISITFQYVYVLDLIYKEDDGRDLTTQEIWWHLGKLLTKLFL